MSVTDFIRGYPWMLLAKSVPGFALGPLIFHISTCLKTLSNSDTGLHNSGTDFYRFKTLILSHFHNMNNVL